MRPAAVLVCLAGLSAAACAPMESTNTGTRTVRQTQARQCFDQSQITNFRQGETQTLYVKVLNRDVYKITSGGCSDLDYTDSLTISQEFPISGRICVGDTVRLGTNSGSSLGNIPCRARVDRQLTAAEIEALPSRQRP